MNIPQQVIDSLKTLEQFILSLEQPQIPPPVLTPPVSTPVPVVPEPAPEPVAQPDPVLTPGHEVIEDAPFSCTTRATMWGLNWNGTNDSGDLDHTQPDGNSRGFFTDPSTGQPYETHNKNIIGASIPREVLLSTFLGVDSWQSDGILTVWKHYASDLRAWVLQHQPTLVIDSAGKYTVDHVTLADAGPAAGTHNGLDLTYATAHLLMTYGGAVCTYKIVVNNKVQTIRGWDYINKRVIGS